MNSIKITTATLAFIGALANAGSIMAQDANTQLGDALMQMDAAAATDSTIAAATGWHICEITRTGAGWGNHYVALTCNTGPFQNKWHILNGDQKDAMLAAALAAASNNEEVQVNIAPATPPSPYNVIRALYYYAL